MSSIEYESRRGAIAVADVPVNIANLRQALQAMLERARAREGYTLFTVNLDHIVKLKQDLRFSAAYDRADFVTADGWPIVWLLKQGGRSLERTTGADLLEPVCSQAAANAIPIYFIGPSPASQMAALEILGRRYPGLAVAGTEAPNLAPDFDAATADAIAARVEASGATLCVISLGAPKQELLADALHARCPEVGFLCFGAALDFISGHAMRAPLWLRRARLEWAWRLAGAPRRMAARYAQCAFALVELALPTVFPNRRRLSLIERPAGRIAAERR